MSAQQKANLRSSYLEILHTWGISVSGNMNQLMNQAIAQEWSTTNFMQHLRKTKDYKQQFPGINSADGMSEAAYNAKYQQFMEDAKMAGVKLSRSQFGSLVRGDVRYEEWKMRVDFQQKVERNKDYFQALQDVAHARGLIKPKDKLTKKELWKLMTRRGNPALERLMEESNVSYQLEAAGLSIGKKGDIARGQVLKFIKTIETDGIQAESLTAEAFAGLAEKVKTVLPAADQIGYGITKGDLFQLEFGGPRQAEVGRHVENILKSVEFQNQPKVNSILVEDEGGSRLTGGSPQRQAGL
jgi:hypothetical protein